VRDRDWCGTANGAMMRLLSLKIGCSNSQVTSHRARKLEWERDVYFTSNRRKVWSFYTEILFGMLRRKNNMTSKVI
jgi:hypothetical protein